MPIAIAEIIRASCTAQRRAPVSPRAPQDILQPFMLFMLSAIASVIKLVNATGNVTSLWLSPSTITEIPCLIAQGNGQKSKIFIAYYLEFAWINDDKPTLIMSSAVTDCPSQCLMWKSNWIGKRSAPIVCGRYYTLFMCRKRSIAFQMFFLHYSHKLYSSTTLKFHEGWAHIHNGPIQGYPLYIHR